MKILKFLSIVLIAGILSSCNQKSGVSDKPIITENDSLSYALGYNIGTNLGRTFDAKDIDKEMLMQALASVLDSTDAKMDMKDVSAFMQGYMEKNKVAIQARQKDAQAKYQAEQQAEQAKQQAEQLKKLEEEFKEDKEAGENFLEENKNKEGVITTDSGLQYIVLKAGNGEKPEATSQVKVHYHGTLTDGTVFDSSVDRGEPTQFNASQVIKGWTEGLQLMPVGSKYKFFIPQELAYGATPRPGGVIKPFAPLVFEVELLEIIKEEKGNK